MSKPVSIKDLEDGKLINKPVHVFGWVKTFRSNRFISFNDGCFLSCLLSEPLKNNLNSKLRKK